MTLFASTTNHTHSRVRTQYSVLSTQYSVLSTQAFGLSHAQHLTPQPISTTSLAQQHARLSNNNPIPHLIIRGLFLPRVRLYTPFCGVAEPLRRVPQSLRRVPQPLRRVPQSLRGVAESRGRVAARASKLCRFKLNYRRYYDNKRCKDGPSTG
jgi:hypothetical protein